MSKQKRRLGDRRDGTLIRELDGIHLIMPMLYLDRSNNEAYISERIDLTKVDAYIEKYNSTSPKFKLTLFHLVVAAVLKTIVLRPKLNRFIANQNYYMRNELSASFVVKKQFSDNSEEGPAFLRAEETSTLESLREDLYKQITKVKGGSSDSTMDAMDFLTKLPRFVVKIFLALMRWCDRHGCVPKSLIASDPYYASVILTNLGSIKLRSGYHHLTNWGTTSLFVVVGEMKKRPFYKDDGSYDMRNSVDLGLTIDERLADGYYYSKSVKLLKAILENPECLEKPFNTPVEF